MVFPQILSMLWFQIAISDVDPGTIVEVGAYNSDCQYTLREVLDPRIRIILAQIFQSEADKVSAPEDVGV